MFYQSVIDYRGQRWKGIKSYYVTEVNFSQKLLFLWTEMYLLNIREILKLQTIFKLNNIFFKYVLFTCSISLFLYYLAYWVLAYCVTEVTTSVLLTILLV